MNLRETKPVPGRFRTMNRQRLSLNDTGCIPSFWDAIIAATSMDAAPAWWPEGLFGEWRLETLREIVLHVVTETATHTGHLDAARELIDGRTWLILD